MAEELYLSQVITNEEIENIKPGCFNILKAPCGWGKTTFMFDDRILNFSRAKKHVLYLIHNTLMRDSIVAANPGVARAFENSDMTIGWFDHRQGTEWGVEKDEEYVHVMCYQTFAALIRKYGSEWLEDIDLIIWDEFDDIHSYYVKEIKSLKKVLPNFTMDRLAALLQEGKSTSIINFVYQIKTLILEPARIRLLAISASPEIAANLFKDHINYILKGQLENKYYAEDTIFVNNVCEAIRDGIIHKGRRYWCYTTTVTNGLRIETMCKAKDMHTLVLWSESNEDWKHLMNEERRAALACIRAEKPLPKEYDIIIITTYGQRGANIYDTSFQDWICDSTVYEDLQQYMRARFNPARQYLLERARGMVDFIQDGFPIDYYQWHSLDELRQLVKDKPVFSQEGKKLLSFNAVKNTYPDLFEMRKYGKSRLTQYRIKEQNAA